MIAVFPAAGAPVMMNLLTSSLQARARQGQAVADRRHEPVARRRSGTCRSCGSSSSTRGASQPESALRLELVLHNHAAFHHELHTLEFSDVCERVAGDGDEIPVLALFD